MDKHDRLPIYLLPICCLLGCDIYPLEDRLISSGGVVNKGILFQATARAYRAGTNEQVKEVFTAADGSFSLDDVNVEGTLYIEVTTTSQTLATCDSAGGCGSFSNGLKLVGEVDKNLNGRIDFGDRYFFNDPAFKLTAYIQSSENETGRFAVTPLTHLAAEKIRATGNLNLDNIRLVNAQVAELFGLDGTDISRMVPPDITDETQMRNASPVQLMYAALNAAVASASNDDTSVADVISSLSERFVDDDGLIANSADPDVVTLASLQRLANDVADVVKQVLPDVDMDSVQVQIQQEINEQEAQTPDTVVMVASNPVQIPDFDKDGVPDSEEAEYGTDPTDADSDNDGLNDGKEIELGTNPLSLDSDGDTMPDGWEVLFALDPLDPDDEQGDLDGDGLINSKEFELITLPDNEDTDGDGLTDGDEFHIQTTSPTSIDSDGDGLTDGDEVTVYETNPIVSDSDNDGMSDGWEVLNGFDPLDSGDGSLDTDGDGVTNREEFRLNFDPNSTDTDDNGVSDGDEDSDGDGVTNVEEISYGFDPTVDDVSTDADQDGLAIIDEYRNGTDPNDPDSDGDSMPDGWEVSFGLDPTNSTDANTDADADGVLNQDEFSLGLNPNNSDTDGDSATDGEEITYGLNPLANDANTDFDGDTITIIDEFRNGSDPDIPNPVIEFVSDAEIYTTASAGALDIAISTDESFTVTSQYDVSDSNMSGVDTNGYQDVLIHDLVNDTYDLPIRDFSSSPNLLSDGNTVFVDMTRDGHSILFSSSATGVIASDTNASEDLFVYDRISKTSKRLGTNAQLTNNSFNGRFRGDGVKVFMESYSSTLVSTDSMGFGDVFLYDLSNDAVELTSQIYSGGDSSNDQSNVGSISADGQRIVYTSRSTDIVDNGSTDSNSFIDVYLLDELGNSHRVTRLKDPGEDDVGADAGWAKISANGKAIVYQTPKDMLDLNVAGSGAGFNQIFHVDVDSLIAGNSVEQYTTLVSSAYDGSNNGYSNDHADGLTLNVSPDGRYVYYKSSATNIVSSGNNTASIDDLYVWDKTTGQNHRASQFVYGTNSSNLLFDGDPVTNHTNGMGIGSYVLNSDGSHIYALLDYGHEYTDAPAVCATASTYCLYKIRLAQPLDDQDGDGLNDLTEMMFDSLLNNPDSDGDGLTDGDEVYQYKTSPLKADTDNDTYSDSVEISNATDPLDPADFPPP